MPVMCILTICGIRRESLAIAAEIVALFDARVRLAIARMAGFP